MHERRPTHTRPRPWTYVVDGALVLLALSAIGIVHIAYGLLDHVTRRKTAWTSLWIRKS